MRLSIITVAMVVFSFAVTATAKQDKSEEFVVTKTSNQITLSSSNVYDKYIITVVGEKGFSYQVESTEPTLNIDKMELPYAGTYSYEIHAVEFLAQAADVQNNGRSDGETGMQSVVDVSSGQFSTDGYSMKSYHAKQEPRLGTLPSTDSDQ